MDEDRHAVIQHNTIKQPVSAQEEYEQVHPIPAEDYSRIQRDIGLAINKPFVPELEEGYGQINPVNPDIFPNQVNFAGMPSIILHTDLV